MSENFKFYLSLVGMSAFVLLVLSHGNEASQVIGQLSKANVNAILALQGRGGNNFIGY